MDLLGLIATLIVGGIIGWLASLLMNTDNQQGLLLNVVVGIIGSWLGRFIFADLLHIGGATNAGAFSISGLFFGILGAVILLAILKMLNVFK